MGWASARPQRKESGALAGKRVEGALCTCANDKYGKAYEQGHYTPKVPLSPSLITHEHSWASASRPRPTASAFRHTDLSPVPEIYTEYILVHLHAACLWKEFCPERKESGIVREGCR
jgi:hypothetical protein